MVGGGGWYERIFVTSRPCQLAEVIQRKKHRQLPLTSTSAEELMEGVVNLRKDSELRNLLTHLTNVVSGRGTDIKESLC